MLKAEAEAREHAGVKADPSQNFGQGAKGKSDNKLGAMAGVSGETYRKGATVLKEGPEEIKELYREGKISTDAPREHTKKRLLNTLLNTF